MGKRSTYVPSTAKTGSMSKKAALHLVPSTTLGGARPLLAETTPSSSWTIGGLIVVILGLIVTIGYLLNMNFSNVPRTKDPGIPAPPSGNILFETTSLTNVSTRPNNLQDPYSPPLKTDGYYFPPDSGDVRGLPMVQMQYPIQPARCNSSACVGAVAPINMQTRGYSPDFTQIGILTYERSKKGGDDSLHDNMILPLMGRRVMSGRDKYQYYTMSNTGAIATKLPVKVRGRNCIGEYGCDELMNGDTVYVDGYNNQFRVTVYENSLFSYIPSL